ncbi:hypothetical protein NDU88_004252 [Pleurodeles waltl]|uniref:Uncharacterized protein n=1 Tax=Pleurodeles waltl TaxID=8319 RepID=A0AAV7W9U2_PLEWA|nr:hypothetical protein NDU88_004252 [Pleurodeles waltl]
MASWFLVWCRKGSGSPFKSCFRCAFDRVGRYIVFRLSVGSYRCGVCFYRRGGRSVKVADCVGGFRHGRDSIFYSAGLLEVIPLL